MLHEFLAANREELIDRCRIKVAGRAAPVPTDREIRFGVPLFLDQLIKTLRMEQAPEPMKSRVVSGPAGGAFPVQSEIGETASQHGRELLERGFTVEQVVHEYGDVCQAVTDLAFEHDVPIEIDEFRTLNRCLDNAIADAVTEFNYQREGLASLKHSAELNERLGFFAHELRNHLNTATLALSAIKAGNAGVGGATGAVLERSLVSLRNLIDRSLTEVRMAVGTQARHRLFSLSDFIAEVTLSATLEAQARRHQLTVPFVDPMLAIDADRDLLLGALGNLLQNAFKFTHPQTQVTLSAYAIADRIRIDVQDHCGGLPTGSEQAIFSSFAQSGHDRSGLGLGLSISRQSVEATGGMLSVRDIPGSGCVFTIELARGLMPGEEVPPVIT